MQNNFENAEYLALAGYTEAQIDRYFKLLDRKMTRGLNALTVADRKFYLKAQTAIRTSEKKLNAVVVAAQKRPITGKQPVETKLHYRWIEAELALIPSLVETLPGEVSAFAIIKEETLAALRKYQPVLDQVDTSKRFKMVPIEADLLAFAAAFGRVANFDRDSFLTAIKAEFPDNYNPAWETAVQSCPSLFGAAISVLDEAEFRAEVRVQIEAATREIYPSVTATV